MEEEHPHQVDEKPAVAGGVDDGRKDAKIKRVWRWPSIPFFCRRAVVGRRAE